MRASHLIGPLLVLLLTARGSGQVVLKPKGQDAEKLIVKALKADVEIESQIATTKLEITFQNTLSQRIEADFIYTLPQDTLVTHFAYWYGDERVVARVVEKERAAAIYKHITTRQRDPALVELIGKRTFRARIFPVMPNADLKVEITMVQVLPSGPNTYSYTMPLKTEKGHYLESLDLNVKVVGDAWTEEVRDNIGMSRATEAKTTVLTLSAKNHRPQKDLNVTVVRRARELQASLYGARSGGRDGFFALTLTPSRAVKSPRLQVSGVKVYDVRPAKLPSVNANQKLTIYGRYSGIEAGQVTLAGTGYKESVEVWFPDQAVANNSATKLWAAAEIERLSGSAKNKGQVIALSIRHTIPSKFTSWLAIPQEELQRYKKEKLIADMDVLAGQLAKKIKQGQENSAGAQTLLARLKAMGREAEHPYEESLGEHLSDYLGAYADKVVHEIKAGRHNSRRAQAARQRLEQLRKIVPEEVDEAYRSATFERGDEIAQALAKEIIAHKDNSPKARNLRKQLEVLARAGSEQPADYLGDHLQHRVYQLARQVVKIEFSARPDEAKLRQLRAEINRLERAGGLDRGHIYGLERHNHLVDLMHASAEDLAAEIGAGRSESKKAAALRAELAKIRGQLEELGDPQEPYYVNRELDPLVATFGQEALAGRGHGEVAREAKAKFDEIAREFGLDERQTLFNAVRSWYRYGEAELPYEKRKTILDRKLIARLEQEIGLLADAVGVTPEQFTSSSETWYRDNVEESIRYELILERRKPHPDPTRINVLENRLRQITAQRRPDTYVKDRIERIAVEVELDKLQDQRLTPEQEAEKQRLQTRQKELRARMGDPLISVDAPKDARQVVAVMPDGITKQLEFNEASRRWEGRFDIPTYVREGEYVVNVFVVLNDGTRIQKEMKYHVDVTKPAARAELKWIEGKLRLEVNASVDTDRVEAVLPWGEMIKVERTSQPGRFVKIIEAPASFLRKRVEIEIIVTDKAHNRTLLKADSSQP
jgi:hypothetical protein